METFRESITKDNEKQEAISLGVCKAEVYEVPQHVELKFGFEHLR